jgi:hypothetical protein
LEAADAGTALSDVTGDRERALRSSAQKQPPLASEETTGFVDGHVTVGQGAIGRGPLGRRGPIPELTALSARALDSPVPDLHVLDRVFGVLDVPLTLLLRLPLQRGIRDAVFAGIFGGFIGRG